METTRHEPLEPERKPFQRQPGKRSNLKKDTEAAKPLSLALSLVLAFHQKFIFHASM